MYKFKIDKIVVNTVDGPKDICPKKINVLVGPNNSGKSTFLKELRNCLTGDNHNNKIINNIDCPLPKSFSELDETYGIKSKIFKDQYGNWMLKAYSNKPNLALDMTVSLESYFTQNMNPIHEDWLEQFSEIIRQNNRDAFLNSFGSLFYQYMGTEERLTICKMQKDYGLDSSNTNYLSSFKYQNKLLSKLAYKVKQLFNKDIFLDSQTLGDRLVFRVGKNFDYAKKEPISTEENAQRLFSEDTLDDQGDGLKSFVSTFLSLNYSKSDILLLDEPEAFLYPPLARQLGEIIGDFHDENYIIFVATHSVEILKGILSKSQDVNIMRITQQQPNKNSVVLLDKDILKLILEDPLLRVSRVLEGIFCDKVIITEAEADELVYQELIEKIFPESGIYFAHGQNKQTLVKIAKLYQKIGINYEIITDFDILRVSSEFNQFLSIMSMKEEDRQKIRNFAERLRKKIEETAETDEIKKKKRDEVYHEQGVRFFEENLRNEIHKVFEQLSRFHLHILETGELETLLENYDVPYKKKKEWIVDAINKIATLSDLDSDSIVYQFLKKIVKNN